MIFPNANKYYLLKYNKGLSYISTQTFIYSITDKFGTNSFKNSMTLPILFIHGNADDYVPTYMGVELYESYRGEKELLLIDGAGHGASSAPYRLIQKMKLRATLPFLESFCVNF